MDAARLGGLDEHTLAALAASNDALRQHDPAAAIRAARRAAQAAPDHPEVLRRLALALSAAGPSDEAVSLIGRATQRAPHDAVLANAQALVLDANSRRAEAIAAAQRAHELAPESADIAANLARLLAANDDVDAAVGVLERAIARQPQHRASRVALAGLLLRQAGSSDASIANLRELVRANPDDAWAWSALAEIEQTRFSAADIEQLDRLSGSAQATFEMRVRAAFALARAREQNGDYRGAFVAYAQANAAMQRRLAWNAAEFSQAVERNLAALREPVPARDPALGSGIVFIVGLPRSGSTLVEQILSSHRAVRAGGERIELRALLAEEGVRRGVDFSAWAARAGADDWQRLGSEYLRRVSAQRGAAPLFTDKLPGNWVWLGAAMNMLPGARVIECRRDRLETAWACYRRLFSGGGQDFSYDFSSIAHFVDDCERSMRQWRRLYPARIRTQHYETLVGSFEDQVRGLLAFCGLDFDPACLAFHRTRRTVATISASQVREPLRTDTARTPPYGALLDPLRRALGLPPHTAGA